MARVICPLSLNNSVNPDAEDCMREQCAWWVDEDTEYGTPAHCIIVEIAMQLGKIPIIMDEMLRG